MSAHPFGLDDVLFAIHYEHDEEPPSPAAVDAWCERFPRFAGAIRAHVDAWVKSDLAANRVPLHYRFARSSG